MLDRLRGFRRPRQAGLSDWNLPIRPVLLAALALFAVTPALAQTGSVTLFELPLYAGRSVTITSATPDLAAQTFARRAQSARVTGSWQFCPEVNYGGTCRTVTGNQRALALLGAAGAVSSLRTTNDAAAAPVGTTTTTTTAATAASAGTAVNIADMDVDPGTEGQDTAYFARPALARNEVSAGTNDKVAADAFCKAAGFGTSAYAGRARAQTSNLIDLSASTRVRGFALRDVLCRR